MPFKSKAQAGFLAEHEPAVFDKFKADTPHGMHVPEHVSPHHHAAHAAIEAIGHIADQMRAQKMQSKFPQPQHEGPPPEDEQGGGDLSDDDLAKLHEFRKSRMK